MSLNKLFVRSYSNLILTSYALSLGQGKSGRVLDVTGKPLSSQRLLEQLEIVEVILAEEAEMDEMWSFVDDMKRQRWLWHAIDHSKGAVLAIP